MNLPLLIFVLAILAGIFVVPLLALVRATQALREIEELRREIRREPSPGGADRAASQPPVEAPAPPEPATAAIAPVVPQAPPADIIRPPEMPLAAPVEPRPDAAPQAAESLEARIGGRWLLYLGVSAIVIAAAYFVKLAFENAWITETMRVAIGGLAGLALVWIGRQFARRGYPLYGQMLAGGGIAILYLSVYAAFNFYALAGRTAAFGLMALVTAFAAWLADAHRSQGLALMAVGGGFCTPFMIGGEVDAQVALFGYDAILVAGTAALAHRRDWPGLNLLGYLLTIVTIVAWFTQFYRDAVHLRTVLFLTLFCAMFGYLLARTWRSGHPLARIGRVVLATAPPAYYLVSIILLYAHPLAFLIFLVAATLVGLVIARQLDSAWGRLLLWVVVAWPLAVWIADRSFPSWWFGPTLVVVLAIHVLHLLTQLEVVHREDRALLPPDVVLLHLSGLGLFGLIDLLIDGRGVLALAGAAAALAVANAALAWAGARVRSELRLQFGALAAALGVAAVALWSGGAWSLLGLGVEAAALVAIGLRTGREWLRAGGSLLLGFAILWFAQLAFLPVATSHTILANARSAAAAVLLALFYGLAIRHRRATGAIAARAQQDSDIFVLALNVVLFVAVTAEINGFWELRGGGRPAELSQMASLAIAWTLQAAWVIRVGLARRREWLRDAGALLLVVPVLWITVSLWVDVLASLTLPQGYVVFVNARAAAAVVIIIALYGLAVMHRRAGGQEARVPLALAILAASVVTLGLLSAEASAFWYLRDAGGGDPHRVYHFARELTLSVLWAAYAAALVGAGIQRRYAPIRYFAIVLFVMTILKVAVVDLAELERLYRVLSVMALGLLLLLASYLYQRFSARLDSRSGRASAPVGKPGPPIV